MYCVSFAGNIPGELAPEPIVRASRRHDLMVSLILAILMS